MIVNVSAVQTRINVNETLNLYRMDTGILPFTITPNYSFNLVFTSNDTNVIRFLDNYGQYEAVGNGIANVTIDLIGYGKYLSSSASMIVTVESIETNIIVNSADLRYDYQLKLLSSLNPFPILKEIDPFILSKIQTHQTIAIFFKQINIRKFV